MPPENTSKKLLILGATSGIGQAFTREAAERGYRMVLAGRTRQKLDTFADALKIAHPSAVLETYEIEVRDYEKTVQTLNAILKEHHDLEGAFLSIGVLYAWDECREDIPKAIEMIETNFVSHVVILNRLAVYFALRGTGFISCVSSIAGDVSYRKGVIYGATKAGLNLYLRSLRYEYHQKGVWIQTIKPGPVATPMIRTPRWKFVIVSPEYAARKIWQGIERHRDVVYVPAFWRPLMAVVNLIPSFIRKRVRI